MWLWWVYAAVVLLVVTPVVLLLAVRIIRTALEISRYAEEIRAHGGGLVRALEPVPALARTAELVAGVRAEIHGSGASRGI